MSRRALAPGRFGAVNILGFNAPEWLIAHFGAVAAGVLCAGVYPSNGPDACRYVAAHSDASVVFVEDAKQLAKYDGLDLPTLTTLVQWHGEPPRAAAGSGREHLSYVRDGI